MFFSSRENTTIVQHELKRNFQNRARKIEAICSEIQSRYLQQGVDYRIKFKCKRGLDCLVLCCASYYLPEELMYLVQYELLHKMRHKFGPDYEQKIVLLLGGEFQMLTYICESSIFGRNTNEVFGNIIASQAKILVVKEPEHRPKRVQRHRGYRDKGSRRIGFEFLDEEKKDFSMAELQRKLEEEREAVRHSIEFWRGFMEL